jgi:hypothetical protein
MGCWIKSYLEEFILNYTRPIVKLYDWHVVVINMYYQMFQMHAGINYDFRTFHVLYWPFHYLWSHLSTWRAWSLIKIIILWGFLGGYLIIYLFVYSCIYCFLFCFFLAWFFVFFYGRKYSIYFVYIMKIKNNITSLLFFILLILLSFFEYNNNSNEVTESNTKTKTNKPNVSCRPRTTNATSIMCKSYTEMWTTCGH